MIKELIDDPSEVVLITRPRRWGKTLNMSMIQHFFSPSVLNKETKGIFDKFMISTVEDGKYLKEHQGRYPVYISFKDLQQMILPLFLRNLVYLFKNFTEHINIFSQN